MPLVLELRVHTKQLITSTGERASVELTAIGYWEPHSTRVCPIQRMRAQVRGPHHASLAKFPIACLLAMFVIFLFGAYRPQGVVGRLRTSNRTTGSFDLRRWPYAVPSSVVSLELREETVAVRFGHHRVADVDRAVFDRWIHGLRQERGSGVPIGIHVVDGVSYEEVVEFTDLVLQSGFERVHIDANDIDGAIKSEGVRGLPTSKRPSDGSLRR